MFSLESPHRGDSNEYTHYTICNIKKKENQPKLSHICSNVMFSKGLKNEFETAVVNEPPVFEPLKFYCNCNYMYIRSILSLNFINLFQYIYLLVQILHGCFFLNCIQAIYMYMYYTNKFHF